MGPAFAPSMTKIATANAKRSQHQYWSQISANKIININIDEGDVLLENFQYVRTVVEYVKKKAK